MAAVVAQSSNFVLLKFGIETGMTWENIALGASLLFVVVVLDHVKSK
ncbi:hypothetical protein [uncultured Shimia sp.]|nr:hypothetical protein [uncultured Shimia sp.]